MNERRERLAAILKSEIEHTNGCTDIGSVCFAVSKAQRELGGKPSRVKVTTSANLYKNAMGVGVPGTGLQGLPIAAALGTAIDHPEAGLAILSEITPEALQQAKDFLAAGLVEVDFTELEGPLYIQATAFNGHHQASVTIAQDYSKVVEVRYDDQIRFQAERPAAGHDQHPIRAFSYQEIYDLIQSCAPGTFQFLVEAAEINQQALALTGGEPACSFNRTFSPLVITQLLQPFQMAAQAWKWTGTASEARMRGAKIPIVALAGSGNHGITQSLGTLAVAESLGVTGDVLEKALALSAATAVYIKAFMNRVTTLCGSALAGGAGIAASTALMLNGSYEQSVRAVQTLIGSLNGMLCEGAGLMCPFKISVAAQTAAGAGFMALRDIYIPAGHGCIGADIEKTFENLGKVNASLNETEHLLLDFVQAVNETPGL